MTPEERADKVLEEFSRIEREEGFLLSEDGISRWVESGEVAYDGDATKNLHATIAAAIREAVAESLSKICVVEIGEGCDGDEAYVGGVFPSREAAVAAIEAASPGASASSRIAVTEYGMGVLQVEPSRIW